MPHDATMASEIDELEAQWRAQVDTTASSPSSSSSSSSSSPVVVDELAIALAEIELTEIEAELAVAAIETEIEEEIESAMRVNGSAIGSRDEDNAQWLVEVDAVVLDAALPSSGAEDDGTIERDPLSNRDADDEQEQAPEKDTQELIDDQIPVAATTRDTASREAVTNEHGVATMDPYHSWELNVLENPIAAVQTAHVQRWGALRAGDETMLTGGGRPDAVLPSLLCVGALLVLFVWSSRVRRSHARHTLESHDSWVDDADMDAMESAASSSPRRYTLARGP